MSHLDFLVLLNNTISSFDLNQYKDDSVLLILQGRVVHPYVPTTVIGALCIVAAFLAFLLPETLGKELPTTLEEAESLSK